MQEGGRTDRWAGWDRAPPQRKRQADGRLSMFDNIVNVNVLFWGELSGLDRSATLPFEPHLSSFSQRIQEKKISSLITKLLVDVLKQTFL